MYILKDIKREIEKGKLKLFLTLEDYEKLPKHDRFKYVDVESAFEEQLNLNYAREDN